MSGRAGTPSGVQEMVKRYGFRFKKHLGQNFLVDRNILTKIVRAAEIDPSDQVLEIGPGIGSLTERLAENCRRVRAVEIDRDLVEILQDRFRDSEIIEIVPGDALTANFGGLFDQKPGGRKLVANLPYYITTPILMRSVEENHGLDMIVVMVQKEVAERMTASPGTKEYGALSVSLQYRGDVEWVSPVPKTVFVPQPKVDSAIIRIRPRAQDRPEHEAKWFREVVKAAFSQRRKTLRNSLKSLSGVNATVRDIDDALVLAGIDGRRRGETLSAAEFVQLTDALFTMIPTNDGGGR